MFKKFLPQIIAMLFLAGFVAYAWTEPASAPPAGNVDAPINVSANSQTFQDSKTLKVKNDGTGVLNLLGGLGVNGLFRAFSDAIFNDKVGIGTTNPQGLLDVGGGKFVVTTEGATNFTAGPNSPTSAADEGPGSSWNNLSGALASDDNRAIGSGINAGFGINDKSTNYLKITKFNFSIPDNATIDGIKVEFEKRGDAPCCGYDLPIDDGVYIVKGGVRAGFNKAAGSWPSIDTWQSYGGPNDKWSLSWSPAHINSTDFGVAIVARVYGDNDDGFGNAYIDAVRIKVYYHTGGTDVAKVSGVTIKGDGSVSTNLNADKLDGLDSTEFGKQGLYGFCTMSSPSPYTVSYCSNVFPPAFCVGPTCNCPDKYTPVMTSNASFTSNQVYNFSCYKQ